MRLALLRFWLELRVYVAEVAEDHHREEAHRHLAAASAERQRQALARQELTTLGQHRASVHQLRGRS
jgi:hypothetical protein